MIIWSRWGILVVLFVGAGVLLGFALAAITGRAGQDGPVAGVFVGVGLLLASVGLYFFDRHVLRPHLDRPRPLYVTERLAEPVVDASGVARTERQVPAVHPETGQPLVVAPRSTLFFIPVRFWPFILGGLGLVVALVNLPGLLTS